MTTTNDPAAHDESSAGQPPIQRVPLRPILIAAAAIAATVALAAVASRVTDIVGLTLAAAITTWLTRPIYRWLSRKIGAGLGITLTTLATFAIVGGVSGLLLRDLSAGASSLSRKITQSIDAGAAGTTLFDRVVRSMHLGDSITNWLSDVPGQFVFGINGQPAVGERIVDISIMVILAAFFHASATPIVNRFVALWQRPERAQVWQLVNDVDRRAGTYLRRTAVCAVLGAVPVAAVAAAVGLPVPVTLGLWAASWMTVSPVGAIIGVIPILGAALSLRPLPAAAVIAVVVVVFLATRTVRRTWISQSGLRPGIGVTTIALATGVAISGSGTAALMFALAAVAVAAITSEHRRGVAVPTPAYTDDRVYRWGPVVIPGGWTGAAMVAVIIAVAVMTWTVIARTGPMIVWLALAILFAIAIDRPVDFLQRTLHARRGVAIGATMSILGSVIAGLVVSMLSEGPTSAAKAIQRLPRVVSRLERAPVIGSWLRDQDASEQITRWLQELPGTLSRARGATNWLPSLGSQLVDVIWILVLTIALVIDGGRIVRAIARRVPARRRRQFDRVASTSHRALAGYAAGAVLISAMNGTVVLILALVLQIGLAPVLALWAFLWDFVPQVGGFIGGAPLMLLALVAGPVPFLVATAVYLIYQLIETNVLYPAIIGDVIDIPAWAAMLVTLIGAAAGGIVGAVLVTPLVGVARLLYVELNSAEFPGRQAAAAAR